MLLAREQSEAEPALVVVPRLSLGPRLAEIKYYLWKNNGIGSPDPAYPGLLGMLGMHGLRCANRAVAAADLIIGLGMRFDDRVTGKVDEFGRGAQIVHIDIDAAEMGKIIPVTVGIHADLRTALESWLRVLAADPLTPHTAWQREAQAPGRGLQRPGERNGDGVSAIEVLDALFEFIGPDAIVTTDVGQHQMWAAQRARPSDPRKFITSGGAGSMGYGFPAAVGAQFACPDQKVVAVVGDGGFQMTMFELATARRCNLPLKIMVLDNKYLGMVRQWQEMFFERRYSAVDLSDNPDFAALARVYGLAAFTLGAGDDPAEVLARWWACDGPALLHCQCRVEENVFPMVPPNALLSQMVEASS